MTSASRHSRSLFLVLALLVALSAVGTWSPPLHAGSTATVRAITASPTKILADGGESTVQVTVGGDVTPETRLTLTTTLGAFGTSNGPSRISVALQQTDGSEAVATATLVGDGRQGTAAVTARVGESVRSTVVTLVGNPAAISFHAPRDGAVLSAAVPSRVIVEVRDSEREAVPGVAVTLSTSAGLLRSAAPDASDAAEMVGAEIRLDADAGGQVSAFLEAEPGAVTIRATAGEVSAAIDITLHGPPTNLELLLLRSSISLGDDPIAAGESTLVAILLDDGGRPVPRVRVDFSTDVPGVAVVHSGAGESPTTDSGGRASGHLSAADAEQTGPVTVTVRVNGLEASAVVRVAGPAAAISLAVEPAGPGLFRLRAPVTDADGFDVPDGIRVRYSASGLPDDAETAFDPSVAEVRDGVAESTLTFLGSTAGVTVRAVVLDISGEVADSVALPESTAVEGLVLSAGLNVVIWPGPTISVRQATESPAGAIGAVWRFDPEQGWEGYFPGPALGVNFAIRTGDRLSVFVRTATVWPLS